MAEKNRSNNLSEKESQGPVVGGASDQGAENAVSEENREEAEQAKIEVAGSEGFAEWLIEADVSIVFTAPRLGRLFMIGHQKDGKLGLLERSVNRCMGLYAGGESLYVGALFQLWHFENILGTEQKVEEYDRLYLPLKGYTTGEIGVTDIAVDGQDRVLFINTLFSCIATLSDKASFTPLWRPPFVSEYAAEDRCRLTGMAMADGRPAYATAAAQTDSAGGWRENVPDGGCVIDIAGNEVVATGLSMPHAPRMREDGLWLLNSGNGEFGRLDAKTGNFDSLAFLPGFARGLDFVGDHAVIGLCRASGDQAMAKIPLNKTLADKKMDGQCGIEVIDMKNGNNAHWLRFGGVLHEIGDIALLPGAKRPMAVGFLGNEIRRMMRVSEDGSL